jgi:hypothetical protein
MQMKLFDILTVQLAHRNDANWLEISPVGGRQKALMKKLVQLRNSTIQFIPLTGFYRTT